MRLKELASLLAISRLIGDGETEIRGIQTDSRKVKPGDLFICVPGLVSDGHHFAAKAVELGAVALVVERDVEVNVPKLVVNDSRYAMAVIADYFYGHPSKNLKVIGITGTNGKTTTSYLIDKMISDSGSLTGLMGTIQLKIGSETIPVERTTQEATDLQSCFRQMVDLGTSHCVMEVSSHALDLGRVKGVQFRSAIFTNLTQDHLDYHGSMEEYRAAKGLLFSRLGNTFHTDPNQHQFAILNADDAASEHFKKVTAAQIITYGIQEQSDVRATDIQITSKGTQFKLHSFAGNTDIQTKLIGKFNVYNSLAAIAAVLVEGVSIESVRKSMEDMPTVDGRMQVVDEGQDYLVVVDYSHTPDGLENALSTIQEFAEGRIICVFGCGGDRDRTKRPIMGEVSAKYSDYVIVTSDNPRTEDPEAILKDIEPGVIAGGKASDSFELITSREEAIRKAIEMASPKDVVLIAGKGHETYQEINGIKYDFDDRQIAKDAIRSREKR